MVVGAENTGAAMRRSTRVRAEIPMRVRSLDPDFEFEDQCQTLLVNTQGCGFQCSRQIPVGIAVMFTIESRQMTATVLNATALGGGSSAWVIGAKLHRTGNFWGLPSPPADWAEAAVLARDAAPAAASNQYIADKVAAEIQRQSEQALAGLRETVDKLLSEREAEILARVSAASAEIANRAAEREWNRVKETMEGLSHQFRQALEQHSAEQTARAEAQLQQVQHGLSQSAEAHFQAVTQEIVDRMRQDAQRLSESAIAQWQKAFEETLQMLPALVRENLHERNGAETPLTSH